MGVLLGTDNGFIFRRTAANTYILVWTGTVGHAGFSQIVSFSGAAYDDPTKIPTFLGTQDVENLTPLYSGDGGATWATGSYTIPAGFATSLNVQAKEGRRNWNVTEDGRVWVFGDRFLDTGFFASPDYTVGSWVQQWSWTTTTEIRRFATNRNIWISDGWVWWLDTRTSSSTPDGAPGVARLRRVDTSGGSYAAWTITPPVGLADLTGYTMTGWPRTASLACWRRERDLPILSIDVTDPDNPAFTWSANQPFGANVGVWDMSPVTNQIIVANAVTNPDDPSLVGSIWRSADGGASWSNVVADTGALAQGDSGFGRDNDISAVAVDPVNAANVWVALCPPYVYGSTDYGATWTQETVDLSQCVPYGGDPPTEWCGIVAAGLEQPTRERIWISTLH